MKQIFTLTAVCCIASAVTGQPGTPDSTFNGNGIVTTNFGAHDAVNAIALQSNGKILAAGYTHGEDFKSDFAVARYNKNGSLDKSFGNTGKFTADLGTNDRATGVAIQADGKIVLAGYTDGEFGSTGNFVIIRLNINGSLDSTFGDNGKTITDLEGHDVAYALALQPDGKILVAGSAANGIYFALARYTGNGMPDTSFGNKGKVLTDISAPLLGNDGEILAIALQPNGDIVAAGLTSETGDWPEIALARYKPGGNLDSSFGENGTVITGYKDVAYSIALQPDGKIVIGGGHINDDDESYHFFVERYNANGSEDTAFAENGRFMFNRVGYGTGSTNAIAIQPDGKIVIGSGVEFNYTRKSQLMVSRLGPNGGLDKRFGTNGFVFAHVTSAATALALQPDGKIIAGGYWNPVTTYIPDNFGLIRILGETVQPVAASVKTNSTALPLPKIYPNPVTKELHVSGLTATKAPILIITDIAGRALHTKKITGSTYTADVSTFKPGRYIATITEDHQSVSLPFIKQ